MLKKQDAELLRPAAFEPSADGHKCCLVAAVTVAVEKESKLLPIFTPMPKRAAVSGLAAVKEALTLCNDRNLRQITGSRIVRIQADGGGEFNHQKLKDLCFDKNIILSLPALLEWHCSRLECSRLRSRDS